MRTDVRDRLSWQHQISVDRVVVGRTRFGNYFTGRWDLDGVWCWKPSGSFRVPIEDIEQMAELEK